MAATIWHSRAPIPAPGCGLRRLSAARRDRARQPHSRSSPASVACVATGPLILPARSAVTTRSTLDAARCPASARASLVGALARRALAELARNFARRAARPRPLRAPAAGPRRADRSRAPCSSRRAGAPGRGAGGGGDPRSAGCPGRPCRARRRWGSSGACAAARGAPGFPRAGRPACGEVSAGTARGGVTRRSSRQLGSELEASTTDPRGAGRARQEGLEAPARASCTEVLDQRLDELRARTRGANTAGSPRPGRSAGRCRAPARRAAAGGGTTQQGDVLATGRRGRARWKAHT